MAAASERHGFRLRSVASRTAEDERGAAFTVYALALEERISDADDTAAGTSATAWRRVGGGWERLTEGGKLREWVVERRFSEFKRLDSQLRELAAKQRLPPPPGLPSSLEPPAERLTSWLPGSLGGGALRPELVQARVAGLDAYLRALLLAVPPSDPLLSDFLRPTGGGEATTPVGPYRGHDPAARARAEEVSRRLFAPLPPLEWALVYGSSEEEDEEEEEEEEGEGEGEGGGEGGGERAAEPAEEEAAPSGLTADAIGGAARDAREGGSGSEGGSFVSAGGSPVPCPLSPLPPLTSHLSPLTLTLTSPSSRAAARASPPTRLRPASEPSRNFPAGEYSDGGSEP